MSAASTWLRLRPEQRQTGERTAGRLETTIISFARFHSQFFGYCGFMLDVYPKVFDPSTAYCIFVLVFSVFHVRLPCGQ